MHMLMWFCEGTESQPRCWMVAEHPVTKHSVFITLLMHACQQVVDLCIGGCSHQHTCAEWGISLRSPHLLAHIDCAQISSIRVLGDKEALLQ